MMKKKNITIEDLARMIAKGFEETAKKDEVNQRFEKVDERFDEVNQRFAKVDERFDEVNQRFEKVDERFDRIEVRLERIEKLLIADHRKRIEKLEAEVRELKELMSSR